MPRTDREETLYDIVEQDARDSFRHRPWPTREDDRDPGDFPRRHRGYRCHDGFCGALDCERCRPGCTEALAAQEEELENGDR